MTPAEAFPHVSLLGMDFAACTRSQLLDHIFAELAEGRGGWLITANLDFLRRWAKDPQMRALYALADLRVADGMPLVWAARLQGDPCPERVAGATMVEDLAARAAAEGRTMALLGGSGGAAARAAEVWTVRYPGLRVLDTIEPWVDAEPTPDQVEPLRAWVREHQPELLLVGLGSPKQERLIRELRSSVPTAWMIGVGVSFSFASGQIRRAPAWMQETGLEWVSRLVSEPKRLARRYLWEDLPFAGELFARSAWLRLRRRIG